MYVSHFVSFLVTYSFDVLTVHQSPSARRVAVLCARTLPRSQMACKRPPNIHIYDIIHTVHIYIIDTHACVYIYIYAYMYI